jgi:hypothetical protein
MTRQKKPAVQRKLRRRADKPGHEAVGNSPGQNSIPAQRQRSVLGSDLLQKVGTVAGMLGGDGF